jgi:hypothetical protein
MSSAANETPQVKSLSDSECGRVDRHVATVFAFLKSEGFRPEVVTPERIYFKFEGHHVYFQANPEDEHQFSLLIPDIWPVHMEKRDLAIRTAHFVSERMLCIKLIVLDNDRVWAAYEGFHASVEAFTPVLLRAVERLQYGARRFVDEFNSPRGTHPLH